MSNSENNAEPPDAQQQQDWHPSLQAQQEQLTVPPGGADQYNAFPQYQIPSVPSSNDGSSGGFATNLTSPVPAQATWSMNGHQHQQQQHFPSYNLTPVSDTPSPEVPMPFLDCIEKGMITYEQAATYTNGYIALTNDPMFGSWLTYLNQSIGQLAEFRKYSPLLVSVVCAVGAASMGNQQLSEMLLEETRILCRERLWPADDHKQTNKNLGDLWAGLILATFFGAKLVGPLVSLSRSLGCHLSYSKLSRRDPNMHCAEDAFEMECLRFHLVLFHYDVQFNVLTGCPPLTPIKGIIEQANFLVGHRFCRPSQDHSIRNRVLVISEMAKIQTRLDPSFSLGHRDYDQICGQVSSLMEEVVQTWDYVLPKNNMKALVEGRCPPDQAPSAMIHLRFNMYRLFIYSCVAAPLIAARAQEIIAHPGRLQYTIKGAAIAQESLELLIRSGLYPKLYMFSCLKQWGSISAPAQYLFSVAFALPNHLDLGSIHQTFGKLIAHLRGAHATCPLLAPISQLFGKLEELISMVNSQESVSGQDFSAQMLQLDHESEALLGYGETLPGEALSRGAGQ